MSTSVQLSFRDVVDRKLSEKLQGYTRSTRLICKTKFKTPQDWSKTYNAIIDTGATITLIPLSIWQDINTEIIADHLVSGIISNEECKVPVKIAKVRIIIFDLSGNCTDELEITSYLSLLENVPLLLGFKDLLSRFKVCFDYEKREGYIEERASE